MGSPGGGEHVSHTYTQNHLHVVFSTKERAKLIAKRDQPKLWSCMACIGRNQGFLVIANGGMEDQLRRLACNTGASILIANKWRKEIRLSSYAEGANRLNP